MIKVGNFDTLTEEVSIKWSISRKYKCWQLRCNLNRHIC